MLTEASIAIASLAFVVLVVFLIITLLHMRRTLRSIRKDLHHVSIEAVRLMHKIDGLTSDIKTKSESLNFVFRPLQALNKPRKEASDTAAEVVDWLTVSLVLFEKIKAAVKHHAK